MKIELPKTSNKEREIRNKEIERLTIEMKKYPINTPNYEEIREKIKQIRRNFYEGKGLSDRIQQVAEVQAL
jgi:formiminotetrahydrofolate cyclodeaminase